MTRSSFTRLLILTFVLAAGAPVAYAEPTPLPQGVSAKAELSGQDRAAIQKWADDNIPGLSNADARVVKASRDALLLPVRADARPSVPFRIEAAKVVMPRLIPLARDQRELTAVNALRVAGELGASGSFDVLQIGLDDARSPVRYAAAFGYARLFETCVVTPAVQPREVLTAITRLSAAGEKATDPRLIDGIILALESAARIPEPVMNDVRNQAIIHLAKIVKAQSARAVSLTEAEAAELMPALLRCASVARSALANVAATPLSNAACRESAAIAGDLLNMTATMVAKPEWAGRKDTLVQVTAAAEAVIFFAAGQLDPANRPVQTELSKTLNEGNASDFLKGVDGVNQRLRSQPFNFAPDRFKR